MTGDDPTVKFEGLLPFKEEVVDLKAPGASHRFRELLAYRDPRARLERARARAQKFPDVPELADEIACIDAWIDQKGTVLLVDYALLALERGLKLLEHGQFLRAVQMGKKQSRTQRARRLDKPASDSYNADRNARIRAFHARLIDADHADATAQTAEQFGLSARQVRRVVGAGRT
jgi:hypothetical protein